MTHDDPTDAELAEMRLARIKSLEAQLGELRQHQVDLTLELERMRSKLTKLIRGFKGLK